VDVLLIDDDPADALMVEEALSTWDVPTKLHVAIDGVEGVEFLRRRDRHRDAPRPAFVLLDLNMPRRNGFEVLDDIKSDPSLCAIPVVVFTTSASESDVLRSYTAHANAYVVKPADFAEFQRAVRDIDAFYTRLCRQPAR
jgi:two-component system response regulator